MNLIQISEQLKEAPDNLLLQEVKAPTGSYPSYLIISELSRRKRLRDGAQQQQAPQTTVADDLSQPAGLAATPQAMQSTAGMDVNGQGDYEEQQEMPQMAGGGLVAFQSGGLASDPLWQVAMGQGSNQRISQYEQDLARARAEEERLGRQLTPEEQNATRESEYGRFGKMVPFRREEQADRIAQRERGLEGERESNANMALMEAGLGMMGSRATRGMQGIAEGGLRGLSSFKSGKQDIKKSEAYLDQAKDNFNRAQELYDAGKYAAGEKALEKAESQRQQGLADARARTAGLYRGRSEERQEQMFPGQLESQERSLQFARDTFAAKVAEANLAPKSREAQIARDNAAANLANAEAAAGGRGGRGQQPKPMLGPGMEGAFNGADKMVMAAQKSGTQIILPNGQPLTGTTEEKKAVLASLIGSGQVADFTADKANKKIYINPFGAAPKTQAPQAKAPELKSLDEMINFYAPRK
jgi:hypothetical protein